MQPSTHCGRRRIWCQVVIQSRHSTSPSLSLRYRGSAAKDALFRHGQPRFRLRHAFQIVLGLLPHTALEVDKMGSSRLVRECNHQLGLFDRSGTEASRFAEAVSVSLIHSGPQPFHLLNGMCVAREQASCFPRSTVQWRKVDDDVALSCVERAVGLIENSGEGGVVRMRSVERRCRLRNGHDEADRAEPDTSQNDKEKGTHGQHRAMVAHVR
jgi:hypothetical protein